jgi:LPXTG-motif cell wall-anchored protein
MEAMSNQSASPTTQILIGVVALGIGAVLFWFRKEAYESYMAPVMATRYGRV